MMPTKLNGSVVQYSGTSQPGDGTHYHGIKFRDSNNGSITAFENLVVTGACEKWFEVGSQGKFVILDFKKCQFLYAMSDDNGNVVSNDKEFRSLISRVNKFLLFLNSPSIIAFLLVVSNSEWVPVLVFALLATIIFTPTLIRAKNAFRESATDDDLADALKWVASKA